MTPAAKKFLIDLLETPSPSGYEEPVQRLVREYSKSFADEIRTDLHGNVIACVNPGGKLRVMYAGHADQIGLIVSYINDQGFLYTNTIGGWDPPQLIGQRLTIHTDNGPVPGIIARKAIHLIEEEERKIATKTKELWIDVGAKNRDEAAALVRIGDAVTLQLGVQELRNGFMNSPGMDDKTGLWVCFEGARRAKEKAKKLNVALYAVATVQEEIGTRGAQTSAFGVDPQVGVAVDVTHATDTPTIDKTQAGDIKLGGGPVIYRGPNMNHKVVERLRAAAEKADVVPQWGAAGRGTNTDANALQLNRAGVATGLVSIPLRYMHSPVELVSLDDVDTAAELLGVFAADLPADADFTPA